MKCPKCGYISFDHHNACPKCKKDISAERGKLNLSDFTPSVPFLLGALTGMADDSIMEIEIAASGVGHPAPAEEELEVEEHSASILEDEDEAASIDHDLMISLDEEWSPLEEEEEESVLSESGMDLDLEKGMDISEEAVGLQDSEDLWGGEGVLKSSPLDVPEDSGEEEIIFDFDEPVPETDELEGPQASEETLISRQEDLSMDLGELSLDEEDLTGGIVMEDSAEEEAESELEIDLDSIALDEEEDLLEETTDSEDQEDALILNLDDLKVNETGELEIGSPAMTTAAEKTDDATPDDLVDMEGVFQDDEEGEAKQTASGPESSEAEDDFTIDLEDFSLEEEPVPSLEDDEEEFSLDIDDLDLDLELEEEDPDKTS